MILLTFGPIPPAKSRNVYTYVDFSNGRTVKTKFSFKKKFPKVQIWEEIDFISFIKRYAPGCIITIQEVEWEFPKKV